MPKQVSNVLVHSTLTIGGLTDALLLQLPIGSAIPTAMALPTSGPAVPINMATLITKSLTQSPTSSSHAGVPKRMR